MVRLMAALTLTLLRFAEEGTTPSPACGVGLGWGPHVHDSQ